MLEEKEEFGHLTLDTLVNCFDLEQAFFDANPAFKMVDPYKKEYKAATKKKDIELLSKLCWFTVLFADKGSIYRNYDAKTKRLLICSEAIEDDDFYKDNKEKLDLFIAKYYELVETPIQRHLRVWYDKLNEKSTLLNRMEYDENNYKVIDDILVNNQKIFKNYEEIKQKVNEEQSKRVKGDAELSFIESGEL